MKDAVRTTYSIMGNGNVSIELKVTHDEARFR